MSDDTQPSTLKSYVDSATATVQSGIASVTGNTADQNQAQATKDKAALENDASHAAANVGPFSISGSGAATKNSSDRTQGSWDQTVGSGKEMLGNAIGNEDLRRSGIEQNQQGKAQEAKGQLSDLGQGIGDRVGGYAEGIKAGVLGDREAADKAADRHDEGKTRQRGAELDIQSKGGQ
ncbi:MAG: hypothetical protein Q9227_006753 [Pyrenula ochraceoflavens]